MNRRHPWRAAVLGAVLVLVAAPGAGTTGLTPFGPDLGVVPVSTQLWVGENDLILALHDASGEPVVDPDAPTELVLRDPDGVASAPVTPVLARFAVTGRELLAARVTFDRVGTWTAEVRMRRAEGWTSGSAPVTVAPDGGTPALGSAVPLVDTPTLADVMNLADAISSDPEQVAAFYWHSVADVLANGQPFVLVLDSYAFRPNEACGGALGILHDIFIEYPGLTVIHAEPWRMRFASGQLTLEPPGGPAELAPWSVAYGVAQPPWVFVVDGDGRLRAKLTGIFGTDELRAAMGAVSTWRPLGAPATPAPPVLA